MCRMLSESRTEKLHGPILCIRISGKFELSAGWPVVIEGSSVAITDAYVHGFVSFQSSVFHSRSALSTRMESS